MPMPTSLIVSSTALDWAWRDAAGAARSIAATASRRVRIMVPLHRRKGEKLPRTRAGGAGFSAALVQTIRAACPLVRALHRRANTPGLTKRRKTPRAAAAFGALTGLAGSCPSGPGAPSRYPRTPRSSTVVEHRRDDFPRPRDPGAIDIEVRNRANPRGV